MFRCSLLLLCFCAPSVFSAQMGAFDVALRHFEECSDVGSGDIHLSVRMKRFNRTTPAADFNLSLAVPYDDQISGKKDQRVECLPHQAPSLSKQSSIFYHYLRQKILYIDFSGNIMFSLAQLTNGGFKQNFFSQKIPKACTTPTQLVPDLWKQILLTMNVTRCPIPKGFYSVKDFTTKDELAKLKVFFFNKYRATQTYIRHGKVVGCVLMYVDLIPKRKHQ